MHYYDDLSSFFLLRKEVLSGYSQKYDYNTGSNRTRPTIYSFTHFFFFFKPAAAISWLWFSQDSLNL